MEFILVIISSLCPVLKFQLKITGKQEVPGEWQEKHINAGKSTQIIKAVSPQCRGWFGARPHTHHSQGTVPVFSNISWTWQGSLPTGAAPKLKSKMALVCTGGRLLWLQFKADGWTITVQRRMTGSLDRIPVTDQKSCRVRSLVYISTVASLQMLTH